MCPVLLAGGLPHAAGLPARGAPRSRVRDPRTATHKRVAGRHPPDRGRLPLVCAGAILRGAGVLRGGGARALVCILFIGIKYALMYIVYWT